MAKRRQSSRTPAARTGRMTRLNTERRAIVAGIRAATASLTGRTLKKKRGAKPKPRPAPRGGAAKPHSATARLTKQKPGSTTKPAQPQRQVRLNRKGA